MYECQDCGCRFQTGIVKIEKHNLDTPPFETRGVCPQCESDNYVELMRYHCRCCGALLPPTKTEFCNDHCRKKGIELRKKEYEESQRRQNGPLETVVKQCDNYNKLHGTRYSYGQFVALILPKINNKRSGKKR